MSAATKNLRFWDNNFVTLDAVDGGKVTFSSELVGFEGINAANTARSKLWKPSGNFEITADNQLIYINDGGDKTVTLTLGRYSPSGLATEIQTRLNITSSNWTVAYSISTFKFTMSNSSPVTLRFSVTTDATWDTIGYTLIADTLGTSFTAQEQRNHTDEWLQVDLGTALQMNSFSVIGPIDELFSISTDATIRLQGNNVDVWDAPPLDLTITRDDKGLYNFFDDIDDTVFRYFRFHYIDRLNPLGPEGVSLGHVYIGDFTTTTGSNIASGFSRTQVDPSIASESEKGTRFFEKRTKYHNIGGSSYDILFQEDRLIIEDVYDIKGVTEPFFVSLDPTASVSEDLVDLTHYVTFSAAPTFQNLFRDKWTVTINFREAI